MTLEELKNKKVTITLNKTFSLREDLADDILEDYIDDQKEEGISDEVLLDSMINNYYGTLSDLIGCVGISDYNINIHD